MDTIKLWHDDVRVPPDSSWTWAKTNDEAILILSQQDVIECSLDHDLGDVPTGETDLREVMFRKGDSRDGSGLDLVKWMIKHDKIPTFVTIHSWNPDGADQMAKALEDAGYICRVKPFKMPADYERIWRAHYE